MRFHEIPFLKLFIGLVTGILLYPYFIIENILGLWLISTLFIGISFKFFFKYSVICSFLKREVPSPDSKFTSNLAF